MQITLFTNNPFKTESNTLCINTWFVPHKLYSVFITKTNHFILLRKMIEVCCENNIKHYENNVQLYRGFLNVTANGICIVVIIGRYVVNMKETYIHSIFP